MIYVNIIPHLQAYKGADALPPEMLTGNAQCGKQK
jgi:hypothetical protein